MVGMGYVELETCYPMFLGSNIGTTFTSMLAALTQSGSDNFKNTIQGSLIHLFFNIIGILLFYPIPFMRFPIPMAKKLGKLTAKFRWFALVYIIMLFFVMPGIFVALTFIDSKECLKQKLPEFLHTFEFLPKPLRSLEPYDKILTSLTCCKKCSADPEGEPVVIDRKPGTTGALNTTFTMLDEKVY